MFARNQCNLLDQYLAILLLVFAEAGLPDVSEWRTSLYASVAELTRLQALSTLATDPQATSTSKKVSRLIGIVLEVAQRVLPPMHAMRVQVRRAAVCLVYVYSLARCRLCPNWSR